ncbi:hypothetical protein [Mucilaginibacter segetis]|uniref:Uncharacterized protein n=1 Tax=Mucilaginibacter segetis TaxID=2793071 RepID=A0A934PP01_9SPHI|nr:hypothetical protein [Mucilaginibacter segetis]MBK0378078.1 hypothetical protein [Mucilaginibacter segetis]
MKTIKTRSKHLIITILFIIIAQHEVFAGGFPVRPKQWLLSPSISYFFSNSGWDANRVHSPFELNGQFTSFSYSLYSEYGISRRFTLVAQLPYVVNNFEQTGYKSHSEGFTDMEIGLRYYLANIDYKYYFTLQATGIVPLYSDINLGYKETGAEIKLAFAGSGHLFGKNSYFNIENGVRQYFGSSGPIQDRYSGTFGLTLDRKFKHQLSVSVGGFYSSSNFKDFSPIQTNNKDFAFNQASLSYGYTFSKKFSIFLTAGTFINGRNTGDGRNVSASFIIKPFR